jgi:hypothetical protein
MNSGGGKMGHLMQENILRGMNKLGRAESIEGLTEKAGVPQLCEKLRKGGQAIRHFHCPTQAKTRLECATRRRGT